MALKSLRGKRSLRDHPWRGTTVAGMECSVGQEDVSAGPTPLPGDGAGTRLSGVPDRKLRSNFTPGTTPWAMRRAQWSALGLSDEDLEKPKIAIVNSSSQLASCFSHLDQV